MMLSRSGMADSFPLSAPHVFARVLIVHNYLEFINIIRIFFHN